MNKPTNRNTPNMQPINGRTLNSMSNSFTSVLSTFRDIEFTLFDNDDDDLGNDNDDNNFVHAPIANASTCTQSFAAIDYGVITANRATVRTTNRSADKLFPLGSEYKYPDLADTTSCSSYGSSSGFSILGGGGVDGGSSSVNIGVSSSTSSDAVNQFLLQQYRAIVTDLECEVQSLQTQLSAKETELRNVELLYSSKNNHRGIKAINHSFDMICSKCGQNTKASQDGRGMMEKMKWNNSGSNSSQDERSTMAKELTIKNETIARLEQKLKDISKNGHHNDATTKSFQDETSLDKLVTDAGRRSSNASISSEKSIGTFQSFASAPVPCQGNQKKFDSAYSVNISSGSTTHSWSLADDTSASGCRIEAILKRLKSNKQEAAGSSSKLQKRKIYPEQSNPCLVGSNVSIASVKSHGSSHNNRQNINTSRRVSSSVFFDKTFRLDDCKIQRHISHPSPVPLSSSSVKDSLRRKSANSCHSIDRSVSVLLNGNGSSNNNNNKIRRKSNNQKRWNQSLSSSMSSFKTELDLETTTSTTTTTSTPIVTTTSASTSTTATTARCTSDRILSSASDYSKSVGQILNDLIAERKKISTKNSTQQQHQKQQEEEGDKIDIHDDEAVKEEFSSTKNTNGEEFNYVASSEVAITAMEVLQQESAGETSATKDDKASNNKHSMQSKKTAPTISTTTSHLHPSMIYQPHARHPNNTARLNRYYTKAHSFTVNQVSPINDRLVRFQGSVDDMSQSLSGNVVFPVSFEDVLEGSMSDLAFRNGKQ